MSLETFTNILEIPSLKKLENQIIDDFGEKNLEKFKESNLELFTQIPHPNLELRTDEMIQNPEKEKINSLLYEIVGALTDISGYKVEAINKIGKNPDDLYFVLIDYKFNGKNHLRIKFGLSP